MPYIDPQFEARRKSIIAGTANDQAPVISQPTRTGFSDPSFEKRRVQIIQSQNQTNQKLPPLTPIEVSQPQDNKPGFFKKIGRVVGIGTGEWDRELPKQWQSEAGQLPEALQPKNIAKGLFDLTKNTYNGIKGIINADAQRYAQKEGQYRIDNNIPDSQVLTYDQTLDFSSVGMLKLAKEDTLIDLQELKAKENKSKLDNYRIKNIEDTVKEIDNILAMPPEERRKKEVFINGLALGRISGNLASGFLGSLSGIGDFIKWRGDVAEFDKLASAGEVAADHLNQWAEAVAPDNPELADEILQGAGSTLAFYIPGAGVSSATAKLATISPKLAAAFGITASATLEAATESGNTYSEMLDAGFSRDDADLAASRVFAGNVIFNVITDKIGLFSDAEGVKKVLTTALAEGSQEAYQDGLQAMAQGKQIDGKQMSKTFFIGAVVGGGMGSVIQDASVNESINEEDRKKLADLAEKVRKVELGEDPEMLGFEFVDNKKPVANFVDSKAYADSIGGEVGETVKIDEIKDPDYAKGEISRQQVDIVKEQIRGGDKINPIVVDKEGNVLDGAHRLTAFREMGVQKVDTVVREEGVAKNKQTYDYGSTQLNLPNDIASEFNDFAKSIPDAELKTDEADGGRETQPHVTVLYGLDNVSEAEVRGLVQEEKPIKVELGKVSIFENEDFDVVKAEVISEQLAALNKKIDDALDAPGNTFDEYKPHVTIAYVKKGQGAKYVGDSRFEGKSFNLNELTFSTKDGKQINIPLGKKTAENKVSESANQTKETTENSNSTPDSIAKKVGGEFVEEFSTGKDDTPTRVYKLKDGNTLYLAIKEDSKTIDLKNIELDQTGDGVGKKIINELKGIADQKGKDFKVSGAFNEAFFDKFDFLKKNFGKNKAVGETTYSYSPKKEAVKEKAKSRLKPKTKAKSRLKQFSGVLSGLANKGADKIHNFELRKPPKPGTQEFKLHKKISELIRKYAQTIGEGYTPRNALGVYFPQTKNIRINNMNNLSVAAHEIAHYLDYAHNITNRLLDSKDTKLKEQMKKMYQQYYPTARPDHQVRLQTLEGFATLLQKYTEQPTTITNEYPDLVKEFLKPGGTHYNKVIGEILTDLNQIVGEYAGLGSLDKIGSRVTSEGTNINKDSFLNFWEKLRTQIADEVYPVEVLAKKGKIGFTKEDPSLWIRAYNAVSGIVNNNISTDRGYWSFTNLQSGWQKKYDFNWKSLIQSTQQRGITDSFSHYLVARREYFMYQELDQLQAQKEIVEKIVKAFDKVDPEKMAEFDRDLQATLSEDYGIDLTEQGYEKAKKNIQHLFERFNKAYLEQKEILDKDGFVREDIEAAYKENQKTFKDEETMFDALTKEDLNLLYNDEVQLINKKTYTELSSKEGYASFKRQFYDEIVGDLDAPGSIKLGGTKVSSLIGRKGSERTIINPLFSAVANHSEIVRKAMKQVVYNQVGKLGASAALPNMMQVVPIQTSVNQQTGAITFPQEKDNNIIMARRGYKRVPILMDSSIKTTIDTLLTHKNVDTFTQLYTGMSRLFTAGTTGLYPSFAITNFMVDQITATANSYNKFKGLYSPMREMLKVMRQKNSIEAKYYEEYLVMGGERQTFSGWQRLEPKDLFKRINDEKSKMDAAIGKMQQGIDILSIPAAKSEIFSRASEYILARKSGKSQIVSLEEAGRVTAPFHHIGAWGAKEGQRGGFGQTVIRGLPFFNASIQVLDQTARVANTKQGRKNMAFVTIAITAAYLSAIMAMMDASDDQKEQYKDLEAEDLANFIYYPNPSGQGLIRVKMANTFSVPGTLINMSIANRMFGAKYDAKDVLEASTAWLPDQFNPTDPTKMILGWIPQVFKPVTHVIFNVKEYPTVKPLVNSGLSRKPSGLQFNEGTSAFAKKIGEMFNLSPIKIDYLLTGYLGRASGFLTGKPGIYNPASSIMRDYYFTSGKRVTDFYKTKEDNNKKYTAYQNYEKGYTDLSKDEAAEIYRVKVISDKVDDLISEYYDMDIEADQEGAAELRAKILLNIQYLEDGTKPFGYSKWAFDARKRRIKNKNK